MTYMDELDEYKRLGEPEKTERAEIWRTAIGLQKVDGLTTSEYLIETAKQNIDGAITICEAQERIDDYYKAKPARNDDRTEEADKVSARIAEILSEKTFSFSPAEYITIHKRLFMDIYKFAGRIRDYNISKDEWVLGGETVFYASADSIRATLDYDFAQEKAFSYKGLSQEQIVDHITGFVSGLWQIHPFGEGNTRTTAVFIVKYLRTLGYSVTNDLFSEHSWYFRNALVRANYNNYKNGIFSTAKYLSRFFQNLLLGGNNILKNRELRISPEGAAKARNVPVNDGDVPVNVPVKRKDRILAMLADDPNLTAEKLAEAFSVTSKTIKRDIGELKKEGRLKRIGSDKTGHWEVLW